MVGFVINNNVEVYYNLVINLVLSIIIFVVMRSKTRYSTCLMISLILFFNMEIIHYVNQYLKVQYLYFGGIIINMILLMFILQYVYDLKFRVEFRKTVVISIVMVPIAIFIAYIFILLGMGVLI